jgi:hypothetical protein
MLCGRSYWIELYPHHAVSAAPGFLKDDWTKEKAFEAISSGSDSVV